MFPLPGDVRLAECDNRPGGRGRSDRLRRERSTGHIPDDAVKNDQITENRCHPSSIVACAPSRATVDAGREADPPSPPPLIALRKESAPESLAHRRQVS